MTWHCAYCNIPNAQASEVCNKCGYHWTQVWKQSKKRDGSRPRPRSQQRPPKTKAAEKSKDKATKTPAEEQEWAVFPASVPWLQTSPQARLPLPKEGVESLEKDPPQTMPPPPTLPPPPLPEETKMNPLAEEELKLLSHLKGLQELGSLPEMLEPQLQMLELRNQAHIPNKGLTHGHVNRLHKAKNQVQTVIKKLNELDKEWKAFMQETQLRFQTHVEHYHHRRRELQESLQKKIQDLEVIKAEVSTVSKSLTAAPSTEDLPADGPSLTEAMQFQQMMTMNQPQEAITEIPSDEEEEDELMSEAKETANKGKQQLVRPFQRMAGSPQKVATSHLKQGTKEAKEDRGGKGKTKEEP
eukprot:Skav236461  [mRNA]  locus=scaffold1758:505530:506594:- [translate_table: standard]